MSKSIWEIIREQAKWNVKAYFKPNTEGTEGAEITVKTIEIDKKILENASPLNLPEFPESAIRESYVKRSRPDGEQKVAPKDTDAKKR